MQLSSLSAQQFSLSAILQEISFLELLPVPRLAEQRWLSPMQLATSSPQFLLAGEAAPLLGCLPV